MYRYSWILCSPWLLVGHSAVAEPAWSGKGEAGLVVASGNNETQNVNGKVSVVRTNDGLTSTAGGDILYASDTSGRTAQRWSTFAQVDYDLSPRVFYFGAARYEDDAFSGLEYQSTLSSGLGRRFIDSRRTQFSGTAGIGYRLSQSEPVFDDAGMLITARDTDRSAVLRSTLDYDGALTDTTKLINKFVSEAGAENTFLQNELSLQVKMNAVLALALRYTVRQNTNPPGDFQKTDTLTTINLVGEIK